MTVKSVEAIKRHRESQKRLKAEFREKMKNQNRLTIRCYISPDLKSKLKDKAHKAFPDLALEDSIGLVLEQELIDMQ